MAAIGSVSPRYRGFKSAVFALLACNTTFYLFAGTLIQALDATAWLVLLALFTLETGFGERFRTGSAAISIRSARLAAAAVCAAGIGYGYQHEWLDALNTGLWVAVVVLLEFEVRHPHTVERRRAWFAATAATLYAGLGTLVLVWAWRHAWFEAYDAALWLTAFAMIEMDVLQSFRSEATV